MPLFPSSPENRQKDNNNKKDDIPKRSPRLSLKRSISSLRRNNTNNNNNTDASSSPGKLLVKNVKKKLQRVADRVMHPGHHHHHRHTGKDRSVSATNGLAAIVPLTTNPFLAPIGGELVPATETVVASPQRPQEAGQNTGRGDGGAGSLNGSGRRGSRQAGVWEPKSDRHVARRSKSLNFISTLLPPPRTRTSSSSTTIDQTISDSGTLASEGLTRRSEEDKVKESTASSLLLDIIVTPHHDPPPRPQQQHHHRLVVVEESTPEAEEASEEHQKMDRDDQKSSSGSISLEPSAGETPFAEKEEAPREEIDGPSGVPSSPHDPLQDVITEPEVPDPFLIDEEGDALSEEERNATMVPTVATSEPLEHSTPAHEISLLPQQDTEAVAVLGSIPPAVDKDVPPLPSNTSDREEAPQLSVPALTRPSMFLPIPNTDPLTTLLSKYIYPPENRPVRDLTGDWQRSDFHTLVMTNSWRALAKMARDHLVTTNPDDMAKILNLWYIRLSSLARLRLFNQTSAECTNLFAVLNAIEPPEDRAWLFDNILPFELEIMHARLKYWAGDHMGHLDALYALLHKCKTKARQAGREAAALAATRASAGVRPSSAAAPASAATASTEESSVVTAVMWKERGVRICLIIASQLIEMNDLTAATKLMEPLCDQPNQPLTTDGPQEGLPNSSIPALRSALGRVYLQSGNLHMAARHFAAAAKDPAIEPATKEMNAALFACADGQWERASASLRGLLEEDAENFVAANNIAVAYLGQGKVQEGISILENALRASPSSVVIAEPFLFNLSTLYELRYANAIDRKRELLVEVAKWSGDGLKTSCLKLPTN